MRVAGTIKRTALQSLRVDQVRKGVATLRFLWYAKLGGRLRSLDEGETGVSANTVSHNLFGLADLAVARSSMLVRPLSVIEALGPTAEILVIGPRTEGEILNLVGHGFPRRHIHAVDLISYSPWIELGNMHALPYSDDSFDAVLMGWVLAYSTERDLVVREVVRAARDGGIVAVGVEYNPLTDDEIQARVGYRVGSGSRIESVDELLAKFQPHVDHVYFAHDVTPERRDRVGAIAVIFSIRK